MVPTMFVAATAPALAAYTAYGVGVRVCTGFNAAKPFVPSLNQIRNCRPGWLNTAALMPFMPGRLVSPKATVNRPLFTATYTELNGSLPFMLEPSLLQ